MENNWATSFYFWKTNQYQNWKKKKKKRKKQRYLITVGRKVDNLQHIEIERMSSKDSSIG
jgi:hypothetical protein